MKALVIESLGAPGKITLQEVKEPDVKPGWLKVKTVAVALNPTDHLHIDFAGQPGGIVGCDYSGTVEEIGEHSDTDIKKGDRIFGLVHGANLSETEGAYAEHLLQKSGLCGKIPEGMSFEEASGLGVALTTIAIALYEILDAPLPDSPAHAPYPILIYGGSTCQGGMAIQFAKLSGLTVITTASPRNFDFTKSRGADAVFDYNSPTCAQDIRSYTNGVLYHAWDTIGIPSSAQICAEALAPDSKGHELKYVTSVPVEKYPRDDVKNDFVMGYTGFGEDFEKLHQKFPAMKERHESVKRFWKLAVKLLEQGKVVPHPVEVCEGGLGGISDGLNRLRDKKVSGKKLVSRIADTHGL